jgi:hypothetical protein
MATLAYPTEAPVKRSDQTDEEFAAEMRAKGYRLVSRWVPDMTNPAVAEDYKRALRKLAEHQHKHPEELIDLTDEDVAGWE